MYNSRTCPSFTDLKLLIQIICLLPPSCVGSFRLTSQAWAIAGTARLFENGVVHIKPHRKDTEFLANFAKHPWFASRIRHIKIYAEDRDMEKWELEIRSAEDTDMHQYLEQRLSDGYLDGASHIMDRIHESADRNYQAMKFLANKQRRYTYQHCRIDLLLSTFPLLYRLSTITITSAQFPFGKNFAFLEGCWDTGVMNCVEYNIDYYQDVCFATHIYTSVLYATGSTSSPIRKLILDQMLVNCFLNLNVSMSEPMCRKVMTTIRSLKIGFIGFLWKTHYEDPYLGQRLAAFLASATQLRSLDLTWQLGRYMCRSLSESFWSNLSTQKYWPHLSSLRIHESKAIQKPLLFPILVLYGRDMERLHLNGVYDCGRGYRTFVDMIRESFEKLQKFELLVGKYE